VTQLLSTKKTNFRAKLSCSPKTVILDIALCLSLVGRQINARIVDEEFVNIEIYLLELIWQGLTFGPFCYRLV